MENISKEHHQKPAIPRDAASIIVVRGKTQNPDVLVGRRPSKARFMPNVWVFPGGALEADDFKLKTPFSLRSDVSERLTRTSKPEVARALAWTALREMYEETGLLIGRKSSLKTPARGEAQSAYNDLGLAPDLSALDYLMRACTPEYQPIRFNTRFFIANGSAATGEIRQTPELEEICWVPLDNLLGMKVASITEIVIEQTQLYLKEKPTPNPERKIMFFSADMDHNRIWHEE
tara:strand:- start:504 stop:1202 length:699 start_codon:yes stop_codon:yes gene_type:complete